MAASNLIKRLSAACFRRANTWYSSKRCFASKYLETPVLTAKIDHVFTITLNRPKKRNCVNPEMSDMLVEAFEKFEKDEDAYVAILRGEGGNFCAGMDLEEVARMTTTDYLPRPPQPNGPMGPTRTSFNKPVIAAIDGYAVAGGMELALMCDLRVMEESAIIGVFCRRFGVPLIDGGTVRLPRLIGLSHAMDLILTGRGVTAKEALSMGLANRVTETGAAFGVAMTLARSLTKFPQECMAVDRQSAYHSVFESKSLEAAFWFEYENAEPVIMDESVTGARQFMSGVGRHGKFHLSPDEKLKQ